MVGFQLTHSGKGSPERYVLEGKGASVMAGEKDKAKGIWDETKGKVKEAVGDATDDRSLQAKGVADQVKGKARKAVGKGKEAVDEVADDALDRSNDYVQGE